MYWLQKFLIFPNVPIMYGSCFNFVLNSSVPAHRSYCYAFRVVVFLMLIIFCWYVSGLLAYELELMLKAADNLFHFLTLYMDMGIVVCVFSGWCFFTIYKWIELNLCKLLVTSRKASHSFSYRNCMDGLIELTWCCLERGSTPSLHWCWTWTFPFSIKGITIMRQIHKECRTNWDIN